MDRLAFDISAPDMIRNTAYLYTNPIDYVTAFVEQLYGRGSAEIHLRPDEILIGSEATLDDKIIDGLVHGRPTAAQKIMPPSTRYTHVTIYSGRHLVTIDSERQILFTDDCYDGPKGMIVQLQRSGDVAEEVDRLAGLYTNSDMPITLNGARLSVPDDAPIFNTGEAFCRVVYNSCSSGGLHFFKKGRLIGKQCRVSGLDILVHHHPFPATITKSRIITSGIYRPARKRLDEAIPRVLMGFAKHIKGKDEYETVLGTLARKYSDNKAVRDFVWESREELRREREERLRKEREEAAKMQRRERKKEEERIAKEKEKAEKKKSEHKEEAKKNGTDGDAGMYEAILSQVSDLTGLSAAACQGKEIGYRGSTLYVGERLLESGDAMAIALRSVPLTPGAMIGKYRKLVDLSRG